MEPSLAPTLAVRHRTGRLPSRWLGATAIAGVTLFALTSAPPILADRHRPVAGPSEPETCSPDWLAQAHRSVAAGPWAVAPLDAADSVAGGTEPARPAPPPSTIDAAPASDAAHPSSVAPPNDELYWAGQFNSLPIIHALDAWDTTFGGDDVTIAIIGDGIDAHHPDLEHKIWRNPGEIPGNGIDDDGNGYVDDAAGWDFGEHDNDPAPVGARGTMMAGIAAAETNNHIGIAGVSWNARVMPLKVHKAFPQADGTTLIGAYPESFTQAVCYAANNHARVILFASFNLQGVGAAAADLDRMRAAIDFAYQHGSLTIAPAGECGIYRSWCPDKNAFGENPPIFPAVFNNVVGVQGFRPGYGLREAASYGSWVDIAAPGEGFYAPKPFSSDYTYIDPSKAIISDFAAAHVAGVVALMMTANPDYPLQRLWTKLCETAGHDHGGTYVDGRNDQYGCGILNAEDAIEKMPWKIRVTPDPVLDMTDGHAPWPAREFVNPYLNAIRWEVHSDVDWLRTEPVTGRPGGPSIARVTADIANLPVGMLQSRLVHTETLHVCTVDAVIQDCQEVRYGFKFVEHLARVFLPAAMMPAH